MRTALAALLVLLLAAAAAARPRDPDYEKVLEAYKAKRWPEVCRLAPVFLEEKPDYRFAHSVRYMRAEALRRWKRLPEARAAFEDYLERHPDGKYADRCRATLVVVLQNDGRYAEAIERADAYLRERPESSRSGRVRFWRARALEEQRRFPEAAEALGEVTGRYAERAAYRLGVVRFRGREFAKAREALESFLADHPGSSYAKSARDYLFRTETGFEEIEGGIVREYSGKYESDPRFARVREAIPALREAALKEIEARIGREVPRTFLIRFQDAGPDHSGLFASTRLEVVGGEPRQMLVLYTEYLVLDAIDLPRTLAHELYHCVQRDALGENHYRVPKWVREGTALYVAGQAESRMRLLAAEQGRKTTGGDPLDRLVNGLGGRHALEDYAEDVAAFLAVEERHGKRKTSALLRRLLETKDVEAAIGEVLEEDFETFEKAAAAHARKLLRPLLERGRAGIHESIARLGRRDWDGALEALPEEPGVYGPVADYLTALIRSRAGEWERCRAAALEFRARHRRYSVLLDNAIYLELRARKALGDPEYDVLAERARKDLAPTGVFRALERLLDE